MLCGYVSTTGRATEVTAEVAAEATPLVIVAARRHHSTPLARRCSPLLAVHPPRSLTTHPATSRCVGAYFLASTILGFFLRYSIVSGSCAAGCFSSSCGTLAPHLRAGRRGYSLSSQQAGIQASIQAASRQAHTFARVSAHARQLTRAWVSRQDCAGASGGWNRADAPGGWFGFASAHFLSIVLRW